MKPGSYPLAIKLAGAETVQAYVTCDKAFSELEDGQPIIVTVEMRATESILDLRVEDRDGTLPRRRHGHSRWRGAHHRFCKQGLLRRRRAHVCRLRQQIRLRLRGAFREFSVSRAKIGVPRELVVRMRPARVTCRVVDEAGHILEDAVVRLTPPAGAEIKGGSVGVDVTYKVDASLRKYHRSGVRCDHGVVSVGKATTSASPSRTRILRVPQNRSPSKLRWSPRAASST